MKKDTAYYAIATIVHSLITKEKMKKTVLKKEIEIVRKANAWNKALKNSL